jgi:PAS domain-containing protein
LEALPKITLKLSRPKRNNDWVLPGVIFGKAFKLSFRTEIMEKWTPVERAEETVIREQAGSLRELDLICTLLNAISELVMVLNCHRQIVFANESLLRFLRQNEAGTLLGIRPGEAFHCILAGEKPYGCGSSQFCDTCGASQALTASHSGGVATQECRIVRSNGGDALDLRVKTTPIRIGDESFTICALVDISHEKRRRSLERIFFHDILNMAVGLKLLFRGLVNAGPKEAKAIRKLTAEAMDRLLEGITSQRDLAAAENNELTLHPRKFRAVVFLRQLASLHSRNHERSASVLLDKMSQKVSVKTDKSVLSRVIGNMIRNALEASGPGDKVTVGCDKRGDRVRFWVHNPQHMAPHVQGQIFQRSFSTKGDGRGLGTYGMKLLTERYLRGSVDFLSTEQAGTTFVAEIPVDISRRPAGD